MGLPEREVIARRDCTGAGDCSSEVHIHGCYADTSADRCDSPEWHRSRHQPPSDTTEGAA